MSSIELRDIRAAARRIAPHIQTTACSKSGWLSRAAGIPVFVKWESQQTTGSFKLRGALNKMILLRERGVGEVLAVSAGNHGLGVAHAAALLGMKATIVVPRDAARTKVAGIRAYGVTLLVRGAGYEEAEPAARALAARRRLEFVSPYNDAEVIAGQGTVALEMIDQAPVDAVLVPVGGGGLLAGAAVAADAVQRRIAMIGVQPRNAAAMHRAFAEGRITSVKERPTCADGLAGNLESNSITLAPIRERARGIVLVGERAIERAIAGFVAREQQVVEGSGAVAAAALLEGKLALPGRARAIGIIVTGRNIDVDRLKSILNRR